MNKVNFQSIFRFLASTRPRIWVLIGFLMSYISFFIYPIFFSSQTMQFPVYLPAAQTIGGDLDQMLNYSKSWAVLNNTPYVGDNLYPPFATIFFAPMLVFSFALAYRIVVLVSLISFILNIIFLTMQFRNKDDYASVFFFVIFTGLFSYGFQFELERGQFNLIAMVFCFAGVWLYHFHHKLRYLAYALFTISVQLKLFPLIFIVMFVSDWREWKKNLKRFFALLGINFALFFIMGPKIFINFLIAVKKQILSPSVMVIHSIRAFVHMIVDVSSENGWMWVREYSTLMQLLLLIVVLSCIFIIIKRAYWHNPKRVNTQLFLACTIGASLIPSVSHDYKLPILAAPTAALLLDMFSRSEKTVNTLPRLHLFMLILIMSTAYSVTFFSYTNKPGPVLGSNFPPLFVMLLVATYYSMMSSEDLM